MPRSIGQTRCGRSSYRIVAAQPVTPKTVAFPFPSTQYDPVEFVLFRNGGEKMRRYHHIGIPTSQPRPGERHIEHLKTFIVGHKNRSEEHTSELQSRLHLVCRLLLEKKKKTHTTRPQAH